MTLSFNMRRSTAVMLTLLLFLATAGFACLVSAVSAMGMPATSSSGMPMNCDRDADRTMSACPHTDGPFKAAQQPSNGDEVPVVAIAGVQEPLVAPDAIDHPSRRAERSTAPPTLHLTPLRI